MKSFENSETQDILKKIKALSRTKKLASRKELVSLCSETISILENEITDYRKSISIADDIPGGLVDFCGAESCDVVVVPDIHARTELIYRILTYSDGEESVFDRLCAGKLKIVFVGDILHSESPKKERWLMAYEEYEKGNSLSDAMTQEMTEGLSCLMQIMILKKSFPEAVHCLKGNHENIMNDCENGNHSFRKFVLEGAMVLDFMLDKYKQSTVELISKFELLLPVAACFDTFMVSHGEPLRSYTKDELVDSVLDPDVVFGLTWTKNGEAEEGGALKMLKECCSKNCGKEIEKKYIAGHRPVRGKYVLRQDGAVVQIHNPLKMQFAYIKAKTGFEPESDVISIED